jgi:hypothetical protein
MGEACMWATAVMNGKLKKVPKHHTDFPSADDLQNSIYHVLLDDIRLIGTGGESEQVENTTWMN